MRRTAVGSALAAMALCMISVHAVAQDASEKEIERYRAMISDPMSNPGFLAVDRGEILWSEKRGSKNVSLEGCDLGLGAGKLEGAFAKLPRYFEDADRVMDLEQRLLWCMQNVQGLDTKDVIARRFSGPGSCLRHGGPGCLHRQQIERHEDRRAAQPPQGSRKWPPSAKRCSIGAAA